jgi:thiosulfate/3-mercaptopyruvate sulfurtransferase
LKNTGAPKGAKQMMTAKVISPEELFERIDDPKLRILDATAILQRDVDGGPYTVQSGRVEFDEVHIPGAAFADVPGELSNVQAPFPFALPSEDRFAKAMGALGVGEGTQVVVYAQQSLMWATRLWWLLRYFGFDDVLVLDGGLLAWLEAELPVSSAVNAYPPTTFHAKARKELVATKDDILSVLKGAPACLVNALPTKAFVGSGPGAYSRPGRIPGSVSVPSVGLLASATGPFRPNEELEPLLADIVASAGERPLIVYCGGGISATVDIFALSLLGHDYVKLYDGSLTEWSADPALPLEVG